MLRSMTSVCALALALSAVGATAADSAPHNVILFVADGLRSSVVTPETAPTLAAIRRDGVDFHNSHSIFPTITTPNASTLATGHLLGDTGDFGNNIYTGAPTPSASGSSVPPLENDGVLGDLNARYGGNYLSETSVLAAAQAKGYSTAALGKLGPVAIQSVTAREGRAAIIIDDATGNAGGIALAPEIISAIIGAGLEAKAPSRGANGKSGDAVTPGTLFANIDQQRWFTAVATRVLLPRFKAAGKPFVLIYWSRDPDGTQHNQGDSLGKLAPGINGPTSMAAIRNADANLAELRKAVADLGLAGTTDILVTADHGFSTVSKQSHTSPAAAIHYPDVPPGQLPVGFVGIDLAAALRLPLYDASGAPTPVNWKAGVHPRFGASLLGDDPTRPAVVVAANGGADLIYLPNGNAQALASRVVRALLEQDYVGAIFVNDALGPLPGSLPMSRVGLIGSARTPQPAIVVGFRSEATGCANQELCAAEVADTSLQQGQGIHGSFSRADTHNFMAAIGPDFKAGFIDPAPTSNPDVSVTMAHLLGLKIAPKGKLQGRVLTEALKGAPPVAVTRRTIASQPSDTGLVTVLHTQTVKGETYFDVAGIAGRTVGLDASVVRARDTRN